MSHNFQEVIDELHRGRDLLTSTSGTQGRLDDLSAVLSNVCSRVSTYCSDAAQDAAKYLAAAQGAADSIRGCISGYSDANEQLIVAIIGNSTLTNTTRLIGSTAIGLSEIQARIDLNNWLTQKRIEVDEVISNHKPTSNPYYINIAIPERVDHILYGDYGNANDIQGHLWPGYHEKDPFPEDWDADRILHNVSLITVDVTTKWIPNRPNPRKQGHKVRAKTNAYKFRWRTIQYRDGINIAVIIEPDGYGVVTAHPVKRIPRYLRDVLS